jgi:multiple sugar transport system substrate-binding protein
MTAPPTTWDEFTKAAVALTKRDAAGRAQRAGFGFGETPARVAHTFLAHLYSNGGRLLTDDGKTGIASEQAVATLEQAVALAKSGATDPALTGVNTENGTVSMAMRASWTRANFREVMGPDFAQKIGVAPIPAGADWRTVAYAFFYAVDARSPVKDEAWKLIAWLNTPRLDGKGSPMGEVLADLGALTGSRADLAARPEVYADPFTKPFVDALERSVPEPTHPATREMEAALQRAVELALRGEATPRDALQAAATEIDGLLAQSE